MCNSMVTVLHVDLLNPCWKGSNLGLETIGNKSINAKFRYNGSVFGKQICLLISKTGPCFFFENTDTSSLLPNGRKISPRWMKLKNKFNKYSTMRSREEYRTNSRHYAVFYSWGHHCGGIRINYQIHKIHTHTHYCMCTQFLSVRARTISVAGRLLVAGPSRDTHCLHFAVLTFTGSCFLIV